MTYPQQQPPVMHGHPTQPPNNDWKPAREKANPLAWAALVVALLAFGGVGWLVFQRETDADATITSPEAQAWASAAATMAALPACKDVFVPGKVVDAKKALDGCKGPAGDLRVIGYFDCADGRKLFQVDANTGAAAGWGFGGAKYRTAKEAASDPEYGKAYQSCNG
jgi:hypothetical protein